MSVEGVDRRMAVARARERDEAHETGDELRA